MAEIHERLQDPGRIESSQPTAEKRENSMETKNAEYVQGLKLYLVLSALTIVYFLIMLDNTILATAIPYITDEFHSLLDVGWYGSAYQLSCAALQPLTGKIYTRINSKVVFIVCLVVFEAGSALCGAAPSSTALIIGRALAGMGGAGLLNGFYINLPIGGAAAAAIVFTHIPDHIPKPHWSRAFDNALSEFDLVGFVLFAPAAIQFFLALQYGGNQFPWNSSQVIGLFCGAGATLVVWLCWNYYQGDRAMVPASMMRNRPVWLSCIVGPFTGATVFVTAYYLPLYFQGVLAYSPFMGGVDVLPNILAQMIFTIIAGGLIQKYGDYPHFTISGSILNAVGCGILGLLTPTTPTGQWIGFQIIFGAGRGLSMSIPFLAVQNSLSKQQIPAAMSILVFLQNFSAAVMTVLAQTIFTNSLVELLPRYAPSVDPALVISAGTTDLRRLVPSDSISEVLNAYSGSLDRVFFFCAGLATPPLLFGWFLVKKEPETHEKDQHGSVVA
ncbi:hypothetical protein TruAng_009599 [Truncatella angustata]|nr:hypothetical protein TruAng_009599 [Truncatella angustata]